MRQYARHKLFVRKVEKMLDEDKVAMIACDYIALSSLPLIPKEKLEYVVLSVIHDDVNFNEIYPELLKSLSKQEIIFRLRRVKYLVCEEDIRFRFTDPIVETAKIISEMPDPPVRMDEKHDHPSIADSLTDSEGSERIKLVQMKRKETKRVTPEMRKWIMENVRMKSCGIQYNGKYSSTEAGKLLGITPRMVRMVVQQETRAKIPK